ncbi:MAG: histidine phosphatase family protein [Deltaproteobacteria bacterium]|nr:histidine phosphatase family protein [Deltaproteobacteria bacterium]MBW2447550.1 histidine phosphatase family protein [Deltaproteobacteria bacterium]
MDLLLVRHARPERIENADGSPADPPLDASGQEQAARVAAWLADEPLDRIYASPMRRARETAAPLLATRGLEALLEPRVAEFDQHSEIYIPLEQLKAEDPERWRAFVQGGYGDGVDFESFCADVVNGLEEIIERHPGERVAVVCHGGVINVWTAHVLGMPMRLFFQPDYASVHRFVAARSGERSVFALNERAR